MNCTPRNDIAKQTGRLLTVKLQPPPCFNFCIDFLVDSVPRNSLTIVDPKYY